MLAAILFLGVAGCADKQTDNSGQTPLDENAAVDSPSDSVVQVKTGSLSIEAVFLPKAGFYQSTATGTIDAKAPLTDAKVEVYTKTDGNKKVVAAAKLGDISEDKAIDFEIILSSNRLTYKIGPEAGSEQNGLPENKKHALGVDVISGDIKANWESKEFSFDDSDAFKIVTQ